LVKSKATTQDIKGEVWFNELRLADMDHGMAAVLNIDSNLADFATVSATGKKKAR
jgi:cell surface protein SprA